jgi:hypothetical protein
VAVCKRASDSSEDDMTRHLSPAPDPRTHRRPTVLMLLSQRTVTLVAVTSITYGVTDKQGLSGVEEAGELEHKSATTRTKAVR